MDARKFGNFDLLRLFLALEVVWIHATASAGQSVSFILAPPVATFVCLSGFLIPKSFAESDGWSHFAWKRILRVGPAFLLSLALVAVVVGPAALPNVLLYYVTMGFAAVASVNGVLWSLMVEEVLYAAHAIGALRKWWNGRTVIGLTVAFTVLSLGLLALTGDATLAAKVGVAASFFAGNAIYFYRERLAQVPVSRLCLILAPVMLAWWLLAKWAPSAPMAVAFVLLAWRLPQFERKIPDLSYGVYVFHQPLLRLIRGEVGQFEPLPMFGLAASAAILLALPSWYLFEAPALTFKNRMPGRKKTGPAPTNENEAGSVLQPA